MKLKQLALIALVMLMALAGFQLHSNATQQSSCSRSQQFAGSVRQMKHVLGCANVHFRTVTSHPFDVKCGSHCAGPGISDQVPPPDGKCEWRDHKIALLCFDPQANPYVWCLLNTPQGLSQGYKNCRRVAYFSGCNLAYELSHIAGQCLSFDEHNNGLVDLAKTYYGLDAKPCREGALQTLPATSAGVITSVLARSGRQIAVIGVVVGAGVGCAWNSVKALSGGSKGVIWGRFGK